MTTRAPEPILTLVMRAFTSTCALVLCLLLLASMAGAQGHSAAAEVEVESPFTPIRAVGFIIGHGTSRQVAAESFREGRAGTWIVRVPLPNEALDPNGFVTAVVMDDEARMAFGTVKPLAAPDTLDSWADLVTCQDEPSSLRNASLAGKLALLESLVTLRAKRRENVQAQTRQALDEAFVERLAKLERGFGLTDVTPLSADLPPALLAQRLARIANTLRNFDASKTAAASASSASDTKSE